MSTEAQANAGFAMDDVEFPDSLFEDDGEQSAEATDENAGTGGDDDSPPDKDDGEGAKEGSEGNDQDADGKNEGEDSPSLEVDGEVYTAERIKELKDGSLRWADYTKKTTELAEVRKTVDAQRAQIEPLIQWAEKIKADKTLVEDIRDALPDEMRETFDAVLNLDTSKIKHPDSAELETLRAQFSELQARETLEKDAKDLVASFGCSRDVADKVIEAAIQHHAEKGVYRAPDDQYKIMLADGLIPKPDKKEAVDGKKDEGEGEKKGTPPKTPPKNQGAKEIKSPAKGGFDTIPISAFRGVVE